MPNFKPDNIRQRKLLDIDFLEVIGDDTFEYCLYVLLEREAMLSAFEATYNSSFGVHMGLSQGELSYSSDIVSTSS